MNKLYTVYAFVLAILLFWPSCSLAGDLQAQAVVEKNRVYVGEPFILQIQVDGADNPEQPDVRPLTDFDVSFSGGQQNSSQSISIVNGKMSRISHQGYVFNYQLSAKKEGNLVIPSLEVKIDKQTLHTEPVNIFASQPQERDDLKLRLSLSKDEAYVGEPLQLEVTWYIGKNVNGFAFNLPVLNDPRFLVEIPPDQPVAGSTDTLVKVPLGDRQVLASKGSGRLGGRKFMTVSFSLILVPKKAGTFALPKSTVSCQVFNSYHQQQRLDRFNRFFQDDIFNNMFNQSRGSYETAIVPSNEPKIHIKELPLAGRPASFTGLVGDYSIATQASADEVNVGDPITLTILVTGPPFLGNVELPPLQQLPAFANGFKIPAEMAPGQVQGKSKVFTQTIRAKRADLTEIPSVELSFFNPATGSFETARSEAIPLKVKKTRIVTAQDAEGGALPATGSELSIQEKGIAHNYEDSDALLPQLPVYGYWTITRPWLLVLLFPPLVFFLCLMVRFFLVLRQKNPATLQARKALAIFQKELKKLPAAPDDSAYLHLAAALRRYLGSRLKLPAASITYNDVDAALAEKGAPEAIRHDLRTLFEICEAASYGAAANDRAEDWRQLIERATETMQQIDRLKI